MKTLGKYILFLFFSASIQSTNAQNSSRVKTFYYGGFGDNINATLFGKVYYPKKCDTGSDTLNFLEDVQLIVFDSKNTIFSKTLIDSSGSYTIDLPGGIYKIIFDKKGFEPLTITNYNSVADQFTQLDIILEKGYQIQYHKIPDWKTFSENRD